MAIQLDNSTGGSITINSTKTGLTLMGTGTYASLGYVDAGDNGNIRIGGTSLSVSTTNPPLSDIQNQLASSGNIAIGDGAFGNIINGSTANIAIGVNAGYYCNTPARDTIIGPRAGVDSSLTYGHNGDHCIIIGQYAGGDNAQSITSTMYHTTIIGHQGCLEKSNGIGFGRYGLLIGAENTGGPEFFRAQSAIGPGFTYTNNVIAVNGVQLHGQSTAWGWNVPMPAGFQAPTGIVTNTTVNPKLTALQIANELILYSNTSATGVLFPHTSAIAEAFGDSTWYLNQWMEWKIYNTSSFTQTLTANSLAITGGTCSIGNNVISYAVALSVIPSVGAPVTATGVPAGTVVIASTANSVTLGTNAGVASNVTGTAIVAGTTVTYSEHPWGYTPASATIASNTAATLITQKVGSNAYPYYQTIRIS